MKRSNRCTLTIATSGLVFLALFGFIGVSEAQATPRDQITQISVQQTWCYGACPIDTLTLNADGSASYESVRNGLKPTGHYTGSSDTQTFQNTANWLEAQNFFGLRSEVGMGNIDASDFIVSVRRGYRTATVAFRLSESNDKTRQKFEDELLPLAKTIKWQNREDVSQSGIKGNIIRDLLPGEYQHPNGTTSMKFVLVRATSRDKSMVEYSTITDQSGSFQFFLLPGTYDLRVDDFNAAVPISAIPRPVWKQAPLSITVENGKFATTEVKLHSIN